MEYFKIKNEYVSKKTNPKLFVFMEMHVERKMCRLWIYAMPEPPTFSYAN